MIALKIIGIIIGLVILLFIGFIILSIVVVVFGGNEHRHKQRCPECGRKAKHKNEKVEECGGAYSYTDAIYAKYECPKGHVFEKLWTTRNPFS
jgi:NADH:ubiquinone oxidoreductase subunit 3 (subunit A)